MKIVAIGDPHITSNFAEFDAVMDRAMNMNPGLIVVLGDLFHTHSTIKADVLDYWIRTIRRVGKDHRIAILRGNHDAPHDKVSYNKIGPIKFLSELDFGPNVIIANEPKVLEVGSEKLLFVPFFYSEDELDAAVMSLSPEPAQYDYIFCHQTFDGGKYENGFYAPDAFSGNILRSLLKPGGKIVSGHLHARQELGEIVYVGTPMWQTRSELNSEKFILQIDTLNRALFWVNTDEVIARPISLELTNLNDVNTLAQLIKNKKYSDVYLTIKANEEEVLQIKKSALKMVPTAKIKVAVQKKSVHRAADGFKKKDFYAWLSEIASQEEKEMCLSYLQKIGRTHG